MFLFIKFPLPEIYQNQSTNHHLRQSRRSKQKESSHPTIYHSHSQHTVYYPPVLDILHKSQPAITCLSFPETNIWSKSSERGACRTRLISIPLPLPFRTPSQTKITFSPFKQFSTIQYPLSIHSKKDGSQLGQCFVPSLVERTKCRACGVEQDLHNLAGFDIICLSANPLSSSRSRTRRKHLDGSLIQARTRNC